MSEAPQAPDEAPVRPVRRVRTGDEAAVRLLSERHLPTLRAGVRRHLPGALRAQVGVSDVVQESWLAAFVAHGKFQDRRAGPSGPWLRGIVEQAIFGETRRNLGAAERDVRRAAPIAAEARGRRSPSS